MKNYYKNSNRHSRYSNMSHSKRSSSESLYMRNVDRTLKRQQYIQQKKQIRVPIYESNEQFVIYL